MTGTKPLTCLIVMLALTGCEAETPSEPEAPPERTPRAQQDRQQAKPRCIKPSKAAVDSLQAGIRGPGRLQNAKAAKSDDDVALRGFQDTGLYYLAAELGDRVFVWGVSGEFLRTGGGLAIGVGPTKEVSRAGDLVDGEAIGLSMGSDDVTTALICARG